MPNEDELKFVGFIIKVYVLLLAVKGCGLKHQEMKAPPRTATVVNVETTDNETKLDLDWDDDIETVERTIYLSDKQFKDVAKPGDKILYKEKINRAGYFSRDIPYCYVWKIGDVIFKEQTENQK